MNLFLRVFLVLVATNLAAAWVAGDLALLEVDLLSSRPTNADNAVLSNFFGISFELSFMNDYFGNDTSTIPPTMLNYLSQIQTGSHPMRLRVGGNSADKSTFVPSQGSPMVQLSDPNAPADTQPVDYSPELWRVLRTVSDQIPSIYLIAVSLNDSQHLDSQIVETAHQILGDSLDAVLVGNEPDLYFSHGERPGMQNYTVENYISEFTNILNGLSQVDGFSTTHSLAGPTICCSWDLATLLQQGFLSQLTESLKYITVQHYPQNYCFGSHAYEMPFYLEHANVVDLAAWQKNGQEIAKTNNASNAPRMLMSEFNSVACGGVPGISDTFGVGALWSIDYALQLASVGYIAAYIHTRERGISYNLLESPASGSAWTTFPPFYSLLVVAEALAANDGNIVVDLKTERERSANRLNTTSAGYAIYDSEMVLSTIILLNYGDEVKTFDLRDLTGEPTAQIQAPYVKFLTAPSLAEKYNISWGGKTFLNVGDGVPVAVDAPWAFLDRTLSCSTLNCSLELPGPSAALIFVHGNSAGHIASFTIALWTIPFGCILSLLLSV